MPAEDVSTRYHLRDSLISVHERKSLSANIAEEYWWMRKFLNNDDLNAPNNIFRKNCRKRSGSSFFYFIILLKTIFLLLFVIPENVSSQQNPDFNQMAFQNMMSLRFDEAYQNLKKSRELNPANPYSV